MKRMPLSVVASSVLVLCGCYAASIQTGRPPSNKVIKKAFASSWIYGLVPPKTVETAAECPNGVARVETQLSFVNQLVGFLTAGIYTPMQIIVTCAEAGTVGLNDSGPEIIVPDGAAAEDLRAAFALTADRAMRTREAVYVRTARVVSEPEPVTDQTR